MPSGIARAKPSAKVLEMATVKACLEVARRVGNALDTAGDNTGADAARLVAMSIQEQLGQRHHPR